jgi:nitrous oxidase accessory protein NosD
MPLIFLCLCINANGQFEDFETHTCGSSFCGTNLIDNLNCLDDWAPFYGAPGILSPVWDPNNALELQYDANAQSTSLNAEGTIAEITSGSPGDELDLYLRMNGVGNHPFTEEVLFKAYLANSISTAPGGACTQPFPGFGSNEVQELISISIEDLDGNGWVLFNLTDVCATIAFDQLIFVVTLEDGTLINSSISGSFLIDEVNLSVDPLITATPTVEVTNIDANLCNDDYIDITYKICSEVPVLIEIEASSSNPSLTANPSTAAITLPTTEEELCDFVTFSYIEEPEIPSGTEITFSLVLTTTFLANDCEYREESTFTHDYTKECPPGFTCPCEGDNPINIDAGDIDNGEQLLISMAPELAGLFENSAYSNNTYVNNGCMAIRGRLVIDGDYAFLGGEIRMQPGSEIVVQSGEKLSIAETHPLYEGGGIHSCEQMWRGIRLENASEIVFEKNEIRDAQYAIQFNNDCILKIDINSFHDNYVGIFKPFTGGTPGLIFQTNPIALNGFSSPDGLLANFNGQTPAHTGKSHAGILIHECKFFEAGIEGNPFSTNLFEKIENGILAYDSGLNLNECTFKNLDGDFNVTTISNPPLEGLGIASFGGLIFQAQDNNFENLERGIHLQNFNSAPVNINDSDFTSVQDGIMISAPIGTVNLSIQNNDIDFRQYGIGLFDAPTLARGNIFNNNIDLLSTGNTYGTMAAIRFSHASSPSPITQPLEITSNIVELSDIGHGIYADESDYIRISSNDITFMDAPINFVKLRSGIHLINNYETLVYDNTLNDDNTGDMRTHGISVRASGRSTICCNYTDGHMTGSYFWNTNMDSHFRFTSINQHDIGLHYTSNAVTGEQEAAGNSWLPSTSYADAAAKHEGIFSTIDLSIYSANPTTWPNPIDLPNGGSANWFEPGPNAAASCENDDICRNAIFPTHYTRTDSVFVDGTLLALTQDTILDWRGKQYVYHKIKTNHTALPHNPLMNIFYTNAQNQAIGMLDSVASGISHLINHHSTASQAISTNKDLLVEYLGDIQEIDSLLALASTTQDSTALWGKRQNVTTSINSTIATIDSLSTILKAERITKAGQLLTYNQSITTSIDPATYEKDANRIYLQHISSDTTAFDAVQYQALLNIAQLCPDKGGRAVGFARALLLKNTSLEFDDESLCQNRGLSNTPKATHSTNAQQLVLIPNPADHFTRVIWDKEKVAQHILVYRIDGVEILSKNITDEQASYDLDINNWLPGLYIIQVQMIDGTKNVGRLIK